MTLRPMATLLRRDERAVAVRRRLPDREQRGQQGLHHLSWGGTCHYRPIQTLGTPNVLGT